MDSHASQERTPRPRKDSSSSDTQMRRWLKQSSRKAARAVSPDNATGSAAAEAIAKMLRRQSLG